MLAESVDAQTQLFSDDAYRTAGPAGCKAGYSPDGNYVVSGGANGNLFVWNVASGILECSLSAGCHKSAVNGVAWKPSGDEIVTVSNDKCLKIWSSKG